MVKLLKIIFTSLLFFQISHCLNAQKSFELKFYIESPGGKVRVEDGGKIDSVYLEKAVSGKLNQLYYDGYLSASVREFEKDPSHLKCYIQKGELFQLTKLGPGNIEPTFLGSLGINVDSKKIKLTDLANIFKQVLDYSENNGYPFAIVKLDSIETEDHEISASLDLFRGPKIVYSKIKVIGYDKLKLPWLENYLGVLEGKLYSEKQVKSIADKLKELSFVRMDKTPEVRFTSTTATIELSLTEKKVNNVDGVIGFLPNQKEDSKLLLTGSFNLHLFNLFSTAKQLHIDWQKVNVNSQTLNTSFYYPQVFKMPLGFSFEFNLLKEDTIYLNRNSQLNIDFNLKPRHKIFFSTVFENSSILGQSTITTENTATFNDYKINYYGLVYKINALDDALLPTSGSLFQLDAFTGSKKFSVPGENPSSEVEIKSTQFKMGTTFEHYFQLASNYIVKFKIRSGNIIGENIFTNDLFRIGGLRTIRGFNENFFYLSDFVYSNLEFRIAQNSATYFFAFYDQGLVNNKLDGLGIDYPIGTGLGLSLGTKSGLFNLVIGIGKSRSQIFSLNSAKIHFGYVGRF